MKPARPERESEKAAKTRPGGAARPRATVKDPWMCTRLALSATALRIRALETGALQLETHLAKLVQDCAPRLLQEFGVATLAAQILCSWSRVGRIRTETAFAAVAGVAPIPASSGQTTRYRLNRCGDRQLSRAIHLIVIARLAHHAETRRYAERRAAKGKTTGSLPPPKRPLPPPAISEST